MTNDLIIKDENDKSIDCVLLYTWSDPSDNNYVFYTDKTKNINGELEILCSRIEENEENAKLYALKDEEWKLAEEEMERQSDIIKEIIEALNL